MKELKEMENLIEDMAMSDLGKTTDVGGIDYTTGKSYLQGLMDELEGELMVYGKSQSQAKKSIKDILNDLVDQGAITEPPSEDSMEYQKAQFLLVLKPKIIA